MASDNVQLQFQERMRNGRGRYEFNEEERQALQECRFESFWYRSFPLSVASGFSMHMMVQRGILSPSKRFGSIPKVIFGTVCGYIIGKMLYVQQCREKFLKLENSPFAEMMRKGKGGLPAGSGFGGLPVPGYSDSETANVDDALRSDTPSWSGTPDNHLNMDIDTSHVKGMDDVYDSDPQRGEELKTSKPEMTVTYDELRKRSRDKNSQLYTQVLPGHYQAKPAPSPSDPQSVSPHEQKVPMQRPPKPKEEFTLGSKTRSKMVNQYGDVWEKE